MKGGKGDTYACCQFVKIYSWWVRCFFLRRRFSKLWSTASQAQIHERSKSNGWTNRGYLVCACNEDRPPKVCQISRESIELFRICIQRTEPNTGFALFVNHCGRVARLIWNKFVTNVSLSDWVIFRGRTISRIKGPPYKPSVIPEVKVARI